MCDWSSFFEDEDSVNYEDTAVSRNPDLSNGTKVTVLNNWADVPVGTTGVIDDWDMWDGTYKVTLPDLDDWFWFAVV